MIGLLGSLVGARGGRMLGGMIGGRTGAMVGSMLGSLVGSRQIGRLARSVMSGVGGDGDGGDGLNALTEDNAQILVELMCNAAKSDGHVDQTETERIVSQLDDVTDDERRFLESQLSSPFIPAAEIAPRVPASLAAEAYAVSLLAVDVDTPAEDLYLNTLAKALDISDGDQAEIRAELGLTNQA